MPKIHIIGEPRDLYRYKTFLNVIIDKKKDWGVSLDYNSEHARQKKRNFFSRKIRAIIKLWDSLCKIWRADFVYIPPMVLGLDLTSKLLVITADMLRKKVIYEFYISFYDTSVLDRKTVAANTKTAKQFSKLDLWGHTRWMTIYLNRCEAERYRALNGLGRDNNVKIIPLSIGSRPFAELKYYRNKDSLCFNMVWWGTYIPLHGLEKIIEATKILVRRCKNIHLYILGNNEELSKEYQIIVEKEEGLSSFITISNEMSFSNGRLLPFLLQNCDMAFGAFGDSEKAKTVILNKAIEAVAMKIPVLTQYSEAFEEYFPPSTTMFYSSNKPQQMAERIEEIMDLPISKLSDHLEEAWKIYDKNFSIEASKIKFGELLDELKDSCR